MIIATLAILAVTALTGLAAGYLIYYLSLRELNAAPLKHTGTLQCVIGVLLIILAGPTAWGLMMAVDAVIEAMQ